MDSLYRIKSLNYLEGATLILFFKVTDKYGNGEIGKMAGSAKIVSNVGDLNSHISVVEWTNELISSDSRGIM